MLGVLEREREGLLKIMDQYYEAHSTIKKQKRLRCVKRLRHYPKMLILKHIGVQNILAWY